jgi:hypothetical protein
MVSAMQGAKQPRIDCPRVAFRSGQMGPMMRDDPAALGDDHLAARRATPRSPFVGSDFNPLTLA